MPCHSIYAQGGGGPKPFAGFTPSTPHHLLRMRPAVHLYCREMEGKRMLPPAGDRAENAASPAGAGGEGAPNSELVDVFKRAAEANFNAGERAAAALPRLFPPIGGQGRVCAAHRQLCGTGIRRPVWPLARTNTFCNHLQRA